MIHDGLGIGVDRDRFIVIRRGEVLAKIHAFFIGPLDLQVLLQPTMTGPPRVLGSSAVARILEVSPGVEENISGKLVVIGPFGNKGLLVRDVDGVASSFAAVHSSYINLYLERSDPYYSLYPYILHGIRLVGDLGEPVLILGCNISSVSAGLYLQSRGISYSLICKYPHHARRLGLNVFKNIGDLGKHYSTLVITPCSTSVYLDALTSLDYDIIKYSALSLQDFIPVQAVQPERIVVEKVMDYSRDTSVARRILHRLKRVVELLYTDDLEKIIDLLPPRGLGLIVGFKPRS